MGLFSEAARTYDVLEEYVGNFNHSIEPIAPLYHKTESIGISVVLTSNGDLVDIQQIDERGIIPIYSGEAKGRSGKKIIPYPLSDAVKNLYSKDKCKLYLSLLKDWIDYSPSTVELEAIYRYMSKETFKDDLKRRGEKTEKNSAYVGWVIITKEQNIKTWKNPNLISSYISYCQSKTINKEKVLSMISGIHDIPILITPPVQGFGTAKIISSNHEKNYIYKDIIKDKSEALTLGYSDTIKAINVLSWLCVNQGYIIEKDKKTKRQRLLLCWSPDGEEELKSPIDFLLGVQRQKHIEPSDYRQIIEKYIKNGQYDKNFFNNKKKIITAILCNTSQGRIATEFYSEILDNEFFRNVAKWNNECCFYNAYTKSIEVPSIEAIAKFSMGKAKKSKEEKDDFNSENNALYVFAFKELIEKKVSGGRMPLNIKSSLIKKCENLQLYEAKDVNALLFITCSVIRKYYFNKKEYKMNLEKDLLDRNYQFGRLLAIFEKIEIDAQYASENDKDSKRVPNAIRLQSMFVKQPGKTAKILLEKLKVAYYPRLMNSNPGLLVYYEQLIGEIMEILSKMPIKDYNRPLGETYVLGYYLQKNDFYTKKNNEEK